MTSRRHDLAAVAVITSVGLITWLVTTASTPRDSDGADEDLGNSSYWWTLLLAAVVVGATARRGHGRLAAVLVVPGLLLAPWTAPRGDNDGLWLLILPMLAAFAVVLAAVARLIASVKRCLRQHAG